MLQIQLISKRDALIFIQALLYSFPIKRRVWKKNNNMKWKSIGYSPQRWHINRQHTGRVKCCSTAPIIRVYNFDLNRMKKSNKKKPCLHDINAFTVNYIENPKRKIANITHSLLCMDFVCWTHYECIGMAFTFYAICTISL